MDNSGVIGYGVFPKFGPDAILMSILLYHFKELTECIEQVERIEEKANNKKKMGLMMNEEKGRRCRVTAAVTGITTTVKVIRIQSFWIKQKRKIGQVH